MSDSFGEPHSLEESHSFTDSQSSENANSLKEPPHKDPKKILRHTGLFLLTFITVTFSGILWVGQSANEATIWEMVPEAALFATLLLLFLGVHEFGHYFAALRHKIDVTMPYFIPVPFGIGTMGAVIRIKEQIRSTLPLFDVGISGPLAGFVVSLSVLLVGLFTLPPPDFIANFAGHEPMVEYIEREGVFPDTPMMSMGNEGVAPGSEAPPSDPGALPSNSEPEAVQPGAETLPGDVIVIGNTLLYLFLTSFFEDVPPMFEMYHYPFLFAGWLGLFFTALNLMPMGQLDGGHILYSLTGHKTQRLVARILFAVLVTLGGIEAIPLFTTTLLEFAPGFYLSSFLLWAVLLLHLLRKAYKRNHYWTFSVWVGSLLFTTLWLLFVKESLTDQGSLIWLVWSFFVAYVVKLEHPPTVFIQPLDTRRKILGWVSMIIFVLCFSFQPITLG
jgi:membrane-associated protease RseP (regulator of RpoE activity)